MSEIIELKQSGVSKEDLQSAGKVNVLATIFFFVALFGLPALAATYLWTVLNMQSVLHIAVTGAQVFIITYIMSVGCTLAPIAVLLGLNWTTKNIDKLSANLTISEEGIRWKPASALTTLLLRIFQQQTKLLPWKEIYVVGSGEPVRTLCTEYGVELLVQPHVQRYLKSDSPLLDLGVQHHVNFIGKDKSGFFKRHLSFFPGALTPEARLQLLSSLQNWAPHLVITKLAKEELVGPALAERDPQFTDIWLGVMDNCRTRERNTDLQAEERLSNDRYRVVQKLATGGQANLYLAEDSHTCDRLVLKEFILSAVTADTALKCLPEAENEIRILQSLNSPFFPEVLDIFVEDGRAYLVIEYFQGRSVREIFAQQGSLPFSDVLAYAKQLCEAIATLHSQSPPIIHRDISPDNIMIDEMGKLKLIDFTVSVRGESDTTGHAVGKPAYMSPDQFRGMTKRANDLYAFGATLFFLLTGRDPEPISQSHAAEVRVDIDIDLDQIVSRCTSMNSSDCYADAMEISLALAAIPNSQAMIAG